MTAQIVALALLVAVCVGGAVWTGWRDRRAAAAVAADLPDHTYDMADLAETACETTCEIPTVPGEAVRRGLLADDGVRHGRHTDLAHPVRRRVGEYSGRHHAVVLTEQEERDIAEDVRFERTADAASGREDQ